jgi:cation transport ATPase
VSRCRGSWRAQAVAEAAGRTAVLVAWDGAARGVLAVADAVKETSAEAVRQLRDLGLHPVLLTGDNATVARAVAAEVGIDEVIPEVLPQEKVDAVRRLQAEGRVVAIPLAMAGLLNPIIAAAAMAFSSVFVVTNSLRLRRFSPLPGNADATTAVPTGRRSVVTV